MRLVSSSTLALHTNVHVYNIMKCCLKVLCWRTVPTDNRSIGEVARGSEPFMRQVFLTGDQDDPNDLSRQVSVRQRVIL